MKGAVLLSAVIEGIIIFVDLVVRGMDSLPDQDLICVFGDLPSRNHFTSVKSTREYGTES